jgi:hypothetical protein
MRVDTQFRKWWAAKGQPHIPKGHVIPILKNLQGHPEAPRQWSRHTDTILHKYHFEPTVHAPHVSTDPLSMMKMFFFFVKLMISLSPVMMNLSTPGSVLTSMLSYLFR